MVAGDPKQPASLADLMETAVSAAHPDRMSRLSKDHGDYRLPFDRLDAPTKQGGAPKGIQWSPGLKAAYNDGYDPLLWIGRGAFSEVWRCVDRSFGREVAIKVPFHDTEKNSDLVVAALQSEAELLGRLHHPGIVHAVRRSGEGLDAYLALDFIDGEDLIEHCRLLDLDDNARLRLFEKALEATTYLHRKGVVHGDLKPDHILVGENDQPVLIDFGLSSSDSSSLKLSDTRRIGGSGRFRAPEITNGSAVSPGPQQDVYSLGVILRELLGDDADGPIDPRIQPIVDRAVLAEPDQRWGDASAMLEALRSHQEPNSIIDSPTHGITKDVQHATAPHVLRLALPIAVIAAVLIGGALLLTGLFNTEPVDDATEHENTTDRPIAQASLFDLALQDIYSGNQDQANNRIDQIAHQSSGSSSTWEHRHLRAMKEARGQVHPYGRLPFSESHALCVAYDPSSQTVAYTVRQGRRYQLWVRPLNVPARHFANSVEAIRAIAISPGSDRVASIDMNGRVIVWTLEDGGATAQQSHELPRQADDRVVWFSADGESLFLFSPRGRSLECWSVENPLPAKPAFVIKDCDHAYQLPSGGGQFMVATAGKHTNNGLTRLRQYDPQGKIVRQLELVDGLVPSSADSGPGQNATVSLGMPNGFVYTHRAEHGGWQKPCDLGLNEAIPAIVYSELEQRAFAALGRIHVVAPDGRLIMRLGDRNGMQQLVTHLDFDNNTSTLTCVSIREFWRCVAD